MASNLKCAGVTRETLVLNKCVFLFLLLWHTSETMSSSWRDLLAISTIITALSFLHSAFSFLFRDVQPWGEEGWLEFGEGGGHSLRWAARGQSVFSESQTEHTHTQGAAPPTHPRTNSHTVRRRGKWMCAAALPRPDAFSEALKTHTEGKCRFLEFICILLEIYAHLRNYHALIYIEQSTSQFSLCVE